MILLNFGNMPWNSNTRKRNQTIFEKLSSSDHFSRGIFFNPPVSLGEFDLQPKQNQTILNSQKINIVSTVFFLPFAYKKPITKITAQLLSIWIKFKYIKGEKYIIWGNTFNIFSESIIKCLRKGAEQTIFDMSDDFTTFDNAYNKTTGPTNRFISLYDKCIFVNKHIADKFDHDNKFILENGIDFELFSKRNKIIIQGVAPKKPTAIYIGFTGWMNDKRIDLDLLKKLIKHFKDCKFVFIARINTQAIRNELIRHENVSLVDIVNYKYLSYLVSLFDVAIIPHLDNEHTKGNNLLKLIEYLAVGVPIVSTNSSNAENFGDLVLISKSHDEFISNIEKVLSSEVNVDKRKAIDVAKNLDWGKKVTYILERVLKF